MIIKMFLAIILLFPSRDVVHSDRLSLPKSFQFYFATGRRISLESKDTTLLKQWSKFILDNKNLTSVEVVFTTGERAEFLGNGTKWQQIRIRQARQAISVPAAVVAKINEIRFDEMELLWTGDRETSFQSEYLNLVFSTGNEKLYGEYPQVQLLCYGLSNGNLKY